MNVAGQQALDAARARFQAFGTAAQPAAPAALPALPAAASQAQPLSADAAAAARVRHELKHVRIRVPAHPSTLDVLNGFTRAMKTPGLSKAAVSRLYELQSKLFEMHKESMNVVLNMDR